MSPRSARRHLPLRDAGGALVLIASYREVTARRQLDLIREAASALSLAGRAALTTANRVAAGAVA